MAIPVDQTVPGTKKVVLIVIDALASRVVRPALQAGRLPVLQALAECGEIDWNSTAIFPSITPAATSSIITGRYPREHRILGAHFYDRGQDYVHYYGPDMWLILSTGMDRFFNDFLVDLNHLQLSSPTAFEVVEQAALTAASLNYMIYRGLQSHEANTPFLLGLLPGVPWRESLNGPSTLCLGDFVRRHSENSELGEDIGLKGRFGFSDEATGRLLLELASVGLPDLSVAYFPDNDFQSHELGPEGAIKTLESVDQQLGVFIQKLGGLKKALSDLAIVVTGDHSQSDLNDDPSTTAIDIGEILREFSQSTPGKDWGGDDQIMICPNLRAAQVYLREGAPTRICDVVERLLRCERIDQVIWREMNEENQAIAYHVATIGDARLRFALDLEKTGPVDAYGQHWKLEGDMSTIDAYVNDQNQIVYGDYPNCLERIACAFEPQASGDIWVTARPGYEFYHAGAEIHPGGGSHGSLHRDDSTSPLIVAGLPEGISMPNNPRSVDVAPLCLRILGVEGTLGIDKAHALVGSTG